MIQERLIFVPTETAGTRLAKYQMRLWSLHPKNYLKEISEEAKRRNLNFNARKIGSVKNIHLDKP